MNLKKFLSLILALCLVVCFIASCKKTPDDQDTNDNGNGTSDAGGANTETVDYAASVKLDMSSSASVKQEVTVKTYVDGDTTHFHLTESVNGSNVLKARYLAVNTPESTGKIEEWGKTAANFTRSKLEGAASIVIESDDTNWNADSTGGRYLVWIWYKTNETDEYRNLNIELLQNGLAIASNSAQNKYGTTCMAAIAQAKAEKVHVYSNDKDPLFPYGQATELTLKELRLNTEEYDGMKVAFEGVITMNNNNSVYLESYDEETEMYYGMSAYYGYNFDPFGLQILEVGNKVRIVGTVSYYETGGFYQVSGLSYDFMDQENPNYIRLISKGHTAAYTEVDADIFKNGKLTIEADESSDDAEAKEYGYAELSLDASVSMKNLTVKSVYTTVDEESSSYGAMTLTCEAEDGTEITIRTIVLYEGGNLVTESAFAGKTIDVKGLVAIFNGQYQIKLFSMNHVTFVSEN